MLRTFCCQIQLDRLEFMAEDDVRGICELVADKWDENVNVQTGDDEECVNLFIESASPNETWERIKWTFIDSKMPGHELANAIIVTVTGVNGWDDYLLIHHYDADQKTETLPESAG